MSVSGEPTLLFTFGDTSYDVGNTKFFSSEFDPATTWPYGDSVDDPTGRWSDGHIVPEFIGASFAIAGAVILGSQSKTLTMNYGQQISKFVELHKKWSDKERANAIYMINIGADDYLNFAKAHPNANPVEQIAHVANVLQRISREIMSFYRSGGARKFVVQNLGPLSCLAIARQEFKTSENCMEMVNFMVTAHNVRLSLLLAMMTVPYRGLRYSLFDFNGEILRRINEPSRHGYTDTASCCKFDTASCCKFDTASLTFGFSCFSYRLIQQVAAVLDREMHLGADIATCIRRSAATSNHFCSSTGVTTPRKPMKKSLICFILETNMSSLR